MADLLLEKGYDVYGGIRRSSSPNSGRIDHIFDKLKLEYCDVTDAMSVSRLVNEIKPDELYNFAAQSHVKVSFSQPIFTESTIIDGTLNILEAVRNFSPHTKVYYASSSETFGNSYPDFKPVSPYGCAKLYGYHLCELYKEAYGLYIVSGILFNHESPRRGITFVSRKITKGLADIRHGKQEKLVLGNLDASRDWGYAPEFVEAIWLLMQQKHDGLKLLSPWHPNNCEIGTGETHTIREFVEEALKLTGLDMSVVELSDKYKRPFELNLLKADPAKYAWLGWKPKTKFKELVRIMVEADMAGGERANAESLQQTLREKETTQK